MLWEGEEGEACLEGLGGGVRKGGMVFDCAW